LQVAHGVGHEPRNLLRLNAEGLNLGLSVAALERQHFLDVLGAGEIARERERALGILLGEP
jgi:hypothetical protein